MCVCVCVCVCVCLEGGSKHARTSHVRGVGEKRCVLYTQHMCVQLLSLSNNVSSESEIVPQREEQNVREYYRKMLRSIQHVC